MKKILPHLQPISGIELTAQHPLLGKMLTKEGGRCLKSMSTQILQEDGWAEVTVVFVIPYEVVDVKNPNEKLGIVRKGIISTRQEEEGIALVEELLGVKK